MSFIKYLSASQKRSGSFLCVGLDPDVQRFPASLGRNDIFAFNRAVIDATHDVVCAYKPQVAYFSALGAERALEETIDYIHTYYPHLPVILDAKRGDIGSTSVQYAQEAFERYQADAVTINPYMGFDSAAPFLAYADKGVIFLCRTSNPGSADFQDLLVDGEPLYLRVARKIADEWNRANNCLLVVGATWPEQMARLRAAVGDMPFLVPGIGEQGGDLLRILQAGQATDGHGLILSASRAILYASPHADFAEQARATALRYQALIKAAQKTDSMS
jgi:orotidine-5'-phosphate decarboxylase